MTVGCSQVFKANFFFVLEGSNSAIVTLETTITHCLQNKQWYLFSQLEAGRARGSQAILGLTGVLTYCIHSVRQKIVQHEKQGALKVRAFGWKPQTSARGSEGQTSLRSQQWGLFLWFFYLPSCSPLSYTQKEEKTHLFKLILSMKSQVFSFQAALTEVLPVCQNILKNCLPALVVLCTQCIKSRFQKRSLWS